MRFYLLVYLGIDSLERARSGRRLFHSQIERLCFGLLLKSMSKSWSSSLTSFCRAEKTTWCGSAGGGGGGGVPSWLEHLLLLLKCSAGILIEVTRSLGSCEGGGRG